LFSSSSNDDTPLTITIPNAQTGNNLLVSYTVSDHGGTHTHTFIDNAANSPVLINSGFTPSGGWVDDDAPTGTWQDYFKYSNKSNQEISITLQQIADSSEVHRQPATDTATIENIIASADSQYFSLAYNHS
jgi:hypothetical protein